jgi:hypothetical protein
VRLFRIVTSASPGPDDFMSDRAKGKPPPVDLSTVRLHAGFSAFATEAQARAKARGLPQLGQWIAELDIPEGCGVRFERTTLSRGHHTV